LQDLNGPITFSPDGRHFAFMRKREPSSVESVIVTETDNVHNQKVLFERANTELGVSVAWSPAGDGIAAIEYQRDVSGRVHPTVLLIGMDGSVRKELSWNNWESVANLIWDDPARSLLLTASLHSAGTDQTHLQQLSLSGGAVRDVIKDVSGYRSVSETADGAQITAIRVDRQASIWLRDFGVKDTSQRIASEWEAYDSLAWIGPTKIVASSARGGNLNLWLLDVASSERKRLTSEPFADKTPVALPDRNTIVFSSNRGGDFNLWKLDLATGRLSQLTSGANYDETPDCTPDGKWIVYTSWRNTKPGIWKVSVAGGNPIRILPVEARTPVVSPDGTQIACEIRENSRAWKVFIVGLGDKRPRRPVAVIPEGAEYRWSPDGNALDFVDNRAGVSNVWRVPLNGGELTQLTSLGEEGILGFRWSPEGTRLACLRGSDRRDVYLFHRKLN
jgi:Tol biopolymer transport system component